MHSFKYLNRDLTKSNRAKAKLNKQLSSSKKLETKKPRKFRVFISVDFFWCFQNTHHCSKTIDAVQVICYIRCLSEERIPELITIFGGCFATMSTKNHLHSEHLRWLAQVLEHNQNSGSHSDIFTECTLVCLHCRPFRPWVIIPFWSFSYFLISIHFLLLFVFGVSELFALLN